MNILNSFPSDGSFIHTSPVKFMNNCLYVTPSQII